MIVKVNTVVNSFSDSEVCGLCSSFATSVSLPPVVPFLIQVTVSGIGFPVTVQEMLTGSSTVASTFGVLTVAVSGSTCGKQKQGKLRKTTVWSNSQLLNVNLIPRIPTILTSSIE